MAPRQTKSVIKDNRLIIGLDYGTTFTGVSFCESSKLGEAGENVSIIQDWPARNNSIGTREKVPSEVTYQDEGIVWGSLIDSDVPRHMWTKLQLEDSQEGEAAKVRQEVSSARGSEKQPIDIVADFLAQIKAHLIYNLDKRFGKVVWRTLPITLVVTTPAVWSDKAKARTLEAVKKAGFTSLEFPQSINTIITTEPESAAIHTIKMLRGTTQDTSFAVGDAFIIVDMGGGTIDLIAYRIVSLDPTVIEEITVGTGAQCGGSFVDRAFLGWLEMRLGSQDFIKIAGCRSEQVPRISLHKKAALLLQRFRLEVKGGFSGTESNVLQLPKPLSDIDDDESRGISDGELKITPDDMKAMFDKPVLETYELITGQWQQLKKLKKVKPKYVFLVGGFSESPYMFNRVENFVNLMDPTLTVIKPQHAWSAVARGAAVKGLEVQKGAKNVVANRKCRRYYGTPKASPFDASKHREIDAHRNPHTGNKMANHQMEWLLKKGQTLSTSKPAHAKCTLNLHFWPSEKRETTLNLLASNETKAPQLSVDKGVFTVAKLSVDLSGVPENEYTTGLSPTGRMYRKLKFEIEISAQSSLEFFFTVNGKKYASLTANFD
ncbi:hypothetical protein HBI56_097520 [Parastagonospora nodorum]|nr:hypothetical protein HBI10_026530 [Parastagonospora nodorum]KAH4023076.1 hypothetical protein HBI13_094150 [Parastagonospora nodorum]KAH5194515.1 hypothetical protein HBH76_058800 [Parastagonospora nodorum]KAH5509638.1 hypothetical protein HBI31_036100 [Parastagonospora nodorum]KAH6231732.1 hypothetical protein HBI53_028090 [Parastagonospora nodorum]